MKKATKKEKANFGCLVGVYGLIGLIIYFIILFFIEESPFWPVWLLASLVLIGAINSQSMQNETENLRLKKQGVDVKEFFVSGKYISGHPKIDNTIDNTLMYLNQNMIKIYSTNKHTLLKQHHGDIDIENIINVSLEDESSIQTRVGLKRMLLIGLFAFAVKKKVKQELAYIVIDWKVGSFKNETVFEFEGNGSIQKANAMRNRIINHIESVNLKNNS